jgi:hypothetical protein
MSLFLQPAKNNWLFICCNIAVLLNLKAMLFQKLKQFSTTIRANGSQKEFNFLKINSASIPTYHIDVPDERGIRHYFSLIFSGEHWNISGVKVPDWIRNTEKLLENKIQEFEKSASVALFT